ncbi:MAG: prolipoprotein diacylglyceryl transferase, partial [Gammaproteobacteria bacterium]|nr:prolipoprotein diacylglyceryl transferase [Gammaproteobacteria bacterium]
MTPHMIDPIALDLGFAQIHWYGLMYVFGFLGGYGLAIYRIDRGLFPINREQMSDFLSWIALGVIVGGRAGYMFFYQPGRLLDDPLSLFYVWEGGMAFHGGLIGVIALTWIFARKHQVAPLALGDALAPLIPIGLGLGRLGNFIGGELW